jgi:DNA-binding LytR/AlgR family response regulator
VNINKIKEIVPWFSRNYILRMKDEKAIVSRRPNVSGTI